MIVHAYYEEDPRVRREAESLVARGRPVVVLGAPARRRARPTSQVDGVDVHRLDVQRHQGAGLGVVPARVPRRSCSGRLWRRVRPHRRAPLRARPGPLAARLPRLRRAAAQGSPACRVLLDLHEAMPEFFRSRFPGASNPIAHRLLRLQERLSIALSTRPHHGQPGHARAARRARRRARQGRGGPRTARRSPASTPSAHPRRPFRADGTLRLVYAGALTPTYELDVAIDAVAPARAPSGPTSTSPSTSTAAATPSRRSATQASALGLGDRVTFHGRIPIDDVPGGGRRVPTSASPRRGTTRSPT